MTLYHLTTLSCLPAIRRSGLLVRRARCKSRSIWLCDGSVLSWAYLHVALHQGVRCEDLVQLVVTVPDDWLRRGPRAGTYRCKRNIPPSRITFP